MLEHHNLRLQEVFPQGDYQNVEYTFPAVAAEIIEGESVSEAIRGKILNHIRMIIPPKLAGELGGINNS